MISTTELSLANNIAHGLYAPMPVGDWCQRALACPHCGGTRVLTLQESGYKNQQRVTLLCNHCFAVFRYEITKSFSVSNRALYWWNL